MFLFLASALGGPLPDPLPPDTELLEVQEGEALQRYHLRVPERDFWIELTPGSGGGAVCSGGGVQLWVRLSLERSESFEWEPLPEVVDQTCERLEDHAPALEAELDRESERRWRWLLGLALPWLALMGWALPRTRDALGVGVLALASRLALSPRTVLLGGDAAYERLLAAQGRWDPDLYYGDTWATVMGLFGGQVHFANIAFSALTAWLLHDVVDRLAGRVPALGAGLMMVVLPLPVALAGTEVHFVLAALLQVAAVSGALRRNLLGDLLAIASVGLLVNLRPLQVVFALLPLGLLAHGRRWPALVASLGLIGLRVSQMPLAEGAGVFDWSRLPGLLVQAMVPGPGAVDRVLDPTVTPAMLPLLGLGGVLACLNRERWQVLLVFSAGAALSLLPYLPKTWPLADPLRFQLPVQTWWAALAGVGLGAAVQWGRTAVLLLWGAFGVSLYFAQDAGPRWVWMEEYELLRALEPRGALYNDRDDPNGHMGEWAGMEPWTDRAPAGARLWRGTADAHHGWPWADCDLEPIELREASAETDGWIDLGTGVVTIGLYKLQSDCNAGGPD